MSIPILRRKGAWAFSLIEVVLALGVVAFALVAILGIFPAALSQNRKGATDTRAAQLVEMLVATIDAQTATFSDIDCFQTMPHLDLASFSTSTSAVVLYAGYPSPDQAEITPAQNANSIYKIEIKFNNTPVTTLPAGMLNQLQFRVSGLVRRPTDYAEFLYIARKKT